MEISTLNSIVFFLSEDRRRTISPCATHASIQFSHSLKRSFPLLILSRERKTCASFPFHFDRHKKCVYKESVGKVRVFSIGSLVSRSTSVILSHSDFE
jgi:hypothetical protein